MCWTRDSDTATPEMIGWCNVPWNSSVITCGRSRARRSSSPAFRLVQRVALQIRSQQGHTADGEPQPVRDRRRLRQGRSGWWLSGRRTATLVRQIDVRVTRIADRLRGLNSDAVATSRSPEIGEEVGQPGLFIHAVGVR
jgi:hypothetical protein